METDDHPGVACYESRIRPQISPSLSIKQKFQLLASKKLKIPEEPNLVDWVCSSLRTCRAILGKMKENTNGNGNGNGKHFPDLTNSMNFRILTDFNNHKSVAPELLIKAIILMDEADRFRVLSAKDTVRSLCLNHQAETVVDLIRTMPVSRQADILSIDDAVWALCFCGEGRQVFDMVKRFDNEQKTRVFCAHDARYGLKMAGFKEEIDEILNSLDFSQVIDIVQSENIIRGHLNLC